MADLVEDGVVEEVSQENVDTQEKVTSEAEKNEAKKLASMNDKEKSDYEHDKLLAEVQSLKDERTHYEMTNIARGMLSESNVTLSGVRRPICQLYR